MRTDGPMTGLERPPATADVDALVDLLVEVAQAGLRREGTFGPVAAVIDSAGNPRLLSATPDATWRSTEVADALQDAMARFAAGGSIVASGLCIDARIAAPRGGEETAAITLQLEEAHAAPMRLVMPYRTQRGFAGRRVRFGQLGSQPGERRVFR